jgi:hypothetical protein
MRRHFIIASLLGALLLPSTAGAQADSESHQSCFDLRAKPAMVIKSCDAIIAASQVSVSDRVKALVRRAHAHSEDEHYPQAVADLDLAASLDPNNLDVVQRRAIALTSNGQNALFRTSTRSSQLNRATPGCFG